MLCEPRCEPLAGDEAGTREIEIEEAEDAAAGQRAGEVFQSRKSAGEVAGAGDGADRSAGDDVGLEPGGAQRLEHSNVGPTTAAPPPRAMPSVGLVTIVQAQAGEGPAAPGRTDHPLLTGVA